LIQTHQRFKDERRVVVVHTFGVSFGKASSNLLLHPGERWNCRSGMVGRPFPNVEQVGRQILAAIDLGVLADQLLVPKVLSGQQIWVIEWFKVLGTGHVETEHTFANYRRQIDRLIVDSKPMASQADGIAAIFEQFLAILELANRVFTNGLQSALNL